jgi:hypothetical protein
MRRPVPPFCTTLLVLLAALPAFAADRPTTDFRPDPASVQRYGTSYRYPQAGWIVLHIEGEPYERGFQHGKLLAEEIAGHVRCFAAMQSHKSPEDGWKQTRTLVNAIFLRRFDKEYMEEMKGIADGAAEAGARFGNRPIDLVDIAAINLWPEIDTLDSALDATPTGLEGRKFKDLRPMPATKEDHCSAFAATGPATADGKIVFGHITMFALYPANFYNVWLDIKPAKGHRVMMQGYPGAIQSGMDYYMNDAGLLVCETTIRQTHFDIKGEALASRIRRALQYADDIDRAVEILKESNNGLYTNEWLLGDIKTNEIAMFELGTHKSRLWRSSKNEWFGGTEGFYWGCNNTKDLDVRLETISSTGDKPCNPVFCPSNRDKVWVKLYQQHKGKMDASFGKLAFTTPPIAAYHSLDAKFTTSALAKDMKTWALFGPPLGKSWQPSAEERQAFPEVRGLVSNPWAVLNSEAPAVADRNAAAAVDLEPSLEGKTENASYERRRRSNHVSTAWHGTLLPRTEADAWLAAAFADYERIVAREHALAREHDRKEKDRSKEGRDDSSVDRDPLLPVRVAMFDKRSEYLAAARASGDTPLSKLTAGMDSDDWYLIAAGKGVLLLQEIRRKLGDKEFLAMMDEFGRAHAGKPVSTKEFVAIVEKAGGPRVDDLFGTWLEKPGLMKLRLENVKLVHGAKEWTVKGEIVRQGPPTSTYVTVRVKLVKGTIEERVPLLGERSSFSISTIPHEEQTRDLPPATLHNGENERPIRVEVNPDRDAALANGGVFTIHSYGREIEDTLIVYGTADEKASNREAADELQKALIRRGTNITVPIKSDTDVTDGDLKKHHLLLIGRPDSNALVARFKDSLPIAFGSKSFTAGAETYAHMDSAVIAAGENPLNPRYSVVVIAGLSAGSTLRTAPMLAQGAEGADVMLYAHGKEAKAILPPLPELTKELEKN